MRVAPPPSTLSNLFAKFQIQQNSSNIIKAIMIDKTSVSIRIM